MNVSLTPEPERYVNKEEEDFTKQIQPGLFALAGVSVACALLHAFFPNRVDEKTAMFLAVAVVTLVIPQIKKFKGFGIEVERDVKQLKKDVRALQISLKGLVTKFEFDKLVGLNKDEPFMVHYSNRMYDELRRLITMEYVETTGGSIHDLSKLREERDGKPAEEKFKFDLKQYVRIRDEGKEYLRVRQRLESG